MSRGEIVDVGLGLKVSPVPALIRFQVQILESSFSRVCMFSSPQQVEGCICVNPGRLTKRASGGTYTKICVPDLHVMKPDFSSDIGVQILHI